MVQIYNDYKDHVDFLTVYVREAHPTDEWQMKSNVKEDVCYAQPKTLEQRLAIANDFTKRFKYPIPFGVDDMSDGADLAYSAWPERLYIIDETGHMAYCGGMGPFKYYPNEVRAWLAARYGEVKHDAPAATPASASATSTSDEANSGTAASGTTRPGSTAGASAAAPPTSAAPASQATSTK